MEKYLKFLKRNKTLIENFSSLSLLQGLNMILPLITLPYILKIIGTGSYGIIVLANSLLFYFQSFVDFSFVITATRDVAVHRHNKKVLSFLYCRVVSTQLVLLVVSIILFLSIVLLSPSLRDNKIVFFYTLPGLIGCALFPDWFFMGIEKMKFITIFSVAIRVFFTVCVFVFIKKPEDFYLYPAFNSAGYLGAALIAQLLLVLKFNLKYKWIGLHRVFKTLQLNFNIFVNQFFPTLYNNSTTFLLGLLTTPSIVGVYGAAKSIVEVIIRFINILSRVFFPYLNRNFGNFIKFEKIMIGLSFIGFISICILSDIIVSFLHIKGQLSVFILCILALSIPFTALYSCYGTNYFIIKREDKLVMKNTVLASVVGFLLAFPLIINLSGIGAAINLTFARGIMGVGLWWKYKNIKKV